MAESNETWMHVVNFMRERCGVALHDDQHYLLEERLEPVARELGLSSIDRVVERARGERSTGRHARRLIDAMTTHETSFFRDARFWSGFQNVALPILRDAVRQHGQTRIWVAGCSTGQEVVSMAIALAEADSHVAQNTTLLGTDVSAGVVDQARRGVYTPLQLGRGMPTALKARYFESEPTGMRVLRRLRDRMVFKVQNLLHDPAPMHGFHIVTCRNVLIYFEPEDRDYAISQLVAAVHPDGAVGVGNTEVIANQRLGPGWYAPGVVHESVLARQAFRTGRPRFQS